MSEDEKNTLVCSKHRIEFTKTDCDLCKLLPAFEGMKAGMAALLAKERLEEARWWHERCSTGYEWRIAELERAVAESPNAGNGVQK